MINLAFNMESGDPDDAFTLSILATHPDVNLCAVTVNPGTDEQVGLVKLILSKLDKNIPVGSRKPGYDKNCVSSFHYKWLGKIDKIKPDGQGVEILLDAKHKYDDLVVLSGAPLGCIHDFLELGGTLNELVVQGGFAGDNIMEPDKVIEKFKGKITCPTYNLGGDKKAALYITQDRDKIKKQYYCSKNVCHGVCYNKELHEYVSMFITSNPGIKLMYDGMSIYLEEKPNGKLFHDPLAAAVAINKSVCTFKPVRLYYHKGEWGCILDEQSNHFISVDYDNFMFKSFLFRARTMDKPETFFDMAMKCHRQVLMNTSGLFLPKDRQDKRK